MWKYLPTEALYLISVLGFIIFGAVAHSLNAFKQTTARGEEFTRWDFLILAFLAVFSGMFFGLSTYAIVTQNIFIVTLFSGLGAFTGIVGLNKISTIALEFFTGLLKTLAKK